MKLRAFIATSILTKLMQSDMLPTYRSRRLEYGIGGCKMKKEHKVLFEPASIGDLELKNRYTMAPMGMFGMVDKDGILTDSGVEYYVTRAKGGIGLITTGICLVKIDSEGLNPTVLFLTKDTDKWRAMQQFNKMTDRIHAYGSKAFLQLSSGFGRAAMIPLIAKNAVGPSEIPNRFQPDIIHRELTTEEVEDYIESFAQAAAFAKHCGFDGVEIHAVHEGYLLDQFATKIFNKRTDRFGGSFENRYRFATEIVEKIKQYCGKDFPVSLRYSPKHYMKDYGKGAVPGEDFVEMGRDMPEGLEAAKLLERAGYDALNVDVGCYDAHYWSHPSVYHKDGLYLDAAAAVKEVVDIPIIVAGRMDDPDMGAKAIQNGKCDFIALGRPCLADPYLPVKVKRGHPERVRPCISCNYGCSAKVVVSGKVGCAVNAQCANELFRAITPSLEKKKYVIVGGGPAGAECARVLAMRGNNVTLMEKGNQIGGALIPAGKASFKHHDHQLAAWFANELKLNNVDIRLNCEATIENIKACNPDVVVTALGAKPFIPSIPGVENALLAEEVLNDVSMAGQKIIIIGAGQVGVEVAIWLQEYGKEVTIVEATDKFMPAGHMSDIEMAKDLIYFKKADVRLSTKVKTVDTNGIVVEGSQGEEFIPADTVIMATGYIANRKFYNQLKQEFDCVYNIGDSAFVRNIFHAVQEGYELAANI